MYIDIKKRILGAPLVTARLYALLLCAWNNVASIFAPLRQLRAIKGKQNSFETVEGIRAACISYIYISCQTAERPPDECRMAEQSHFAILERCRASERQSGRIRNSLAVVSSVASGLNTENFLDGRPVRIDFRASTTAEGV